MMQVQEELAIVRILIRTSEERIMIDYRALLPGGLRVRKSERKVKRASGFLAFDARRTLAPPRPRAMRSRKLFHSRLNRNSAPTCRGRDGAKKESRLMDRIRALGLNETTTTQLFMIIDNTMAKFAALREDYRVHSGLRNAVALGILDIVSDGKGISSRLNTMRSS
jgi:hypothetical protein